MSITRFFISKSRWEEKLHPRNQLGRFAKKKFRKWREKSVKAKPFNEQTDEYSESHLTVIRDQETKRSMLKLLQQEADKLLIEENIEKTKKFSITGWIQSRPNARKPREPFTFDSYAEWHEKNRMSLPEGDPLLAIIDPTTRPATTLYKYITQIERLRESIDSDSPVDLSYDSKSNPDAIDDFVIRGFAKSMVVSKVSSRLIDRAKEDKKLADVLDSIGDPRSALRQDAFGDHFSEVWALAARYTGEVRREHNEPDSLAYVHAYDLMRKELDSAGLTTPEELEQILHDIIQIGGPDVIDRVSAVYEKDSREKAAAFRKLGIRYKSEFMPYDLFRKSDTLYNETLAGPLIKMFARGDGFPELEPGKSPVDNFLRQVKWGKDRRDPLQDDITNAVSVLVELFHDIDAKALEEGDFDQNGDRVITSGPGSVFYDRIQNNPEIKDLLYRGRVEGAVSTMVQTWAQSSYHSPLSAILQSRVAKMFGIDDETRKAVLREIADVGRSSDETLSTVGLADAAGGSSIDYRQDLADHIVSIGSLDLGNPNTMEAASLYKGVADVDTLVDAFAEAVYDETQESLKRQGVESLNVHRGVALQIIKGDESPVPSKVVISNKDLRRALAWAEESVAAGNDRKEIDREITANEISYHLPNKYLGQDIVNEIIQTYAGPPHRSLNAPPAELALIVFVQTETEPYPGYETGMDIDNPNFSSSYGASPNAWRRVLEYVVAGDEGMATEEIKRMIISQFDVTAGLNHGMMDEQSMMSRPAAPELANFYEMALVTQKRFTADPKSIQAFREWASKTSVEEAAKKFYDELSQAHFETIAERSPIISDMFQKLRESYLEKRPVLDRVDRARVEQDALRADLQESFMRNAEKDPNEAYDETSRLLSTVTDAAQWDTLGDAFEESAAKRDLDRIMNGFDYGIGDFSDVNVVMQPLSSTSTAKGVADGFSGAVVLSMDVPREHIFSTSLTGVGALNEKEVVLLGGENVHASLSGYRVGTSPVFIEPEGVVKSIFSGVSGEMVLYIDGPDDADWIKEVAVSNHSADTEEQLPPATNPALHRKVRLTGPSAYLSEDSGTVAKDSTFERLHPRGYGGRFGRKLRHIGPVGAVGPNVRKPTVRGVTQRSTSRTEFNVPDLENPPDGEISAAGKLEAATKVVTKAPGFKTLKDKDGKADQKGVYAQFMSNLEAILAVAESKPGFIERTRQWYPGANKLAAKLSNITGHHRDSVSAVLAVLSSSMDWDNNIANAEGILEFWDADPVMTDEIRREAALLVIEMNKNDKGVDKDPKDWVYLDGYPDGTRLVSGFAVDTPKSRIERAVYFRVWDQLEGAKKRGDGVNKARTVKMMINDDGDIVPVLDENGLEKKVNRRYQSSLNIAKALAILDSPTYETIDIELGDGMKVRSFYNNIGFPGNRQNDATIDTHAGSALVGAPYGSTVKRKEARDPKNPPFISALLDYTATGEGQYVKAMMVQAFRDIAKAHPEHFKSAAEAQSVLWEVWRERSERQTGWDKKRKQDVKDVWQAVDEASEKDRAKMVEKATAEMVKWLKEPVQETKQKKKKA
jgi:hypothetical protein